MFFFKFCLFGLYLVCVLFCLVCLFSVGFLFVFVDMQAPYKSTIYWPLSLHTESHCGINSVLATGIGVGALRFETTDNATWVRESLAEMYTVTHPSLMLTTKLT